MENEVDVPLSWLPTRLIDPPSLSASVAIWEEHFRDVLNLSKGDPLKVALVAEASRVIFAKRQAGEK